MTYESFGDLPSGIRLRVEGVSSDHEAFVRQKIPALQQRSILDVMNTPEGLSVVEVYFDRVEGYGWSTRDQSMLPPDQASAPEECADFDDVIRKHDWSAGPQQVLAAVERTTNAERCIEAGLELTSAASDWSTFERYVIAASRRPSSRYTRTLCAVLKLRVGDLNNEDIVETLGAIRDPASVDCLIEILTWQPDWDEFGQLGRKAVWALAAIGTSEAFDAVQRASTSQLEKVREAALIALEAHRQSPDVDS